MSESESTFATALRIPAEHACLPGHFPGRPIAPGVLLLDLVLKTAEDWLGRPVGVAALPQVKFLAPLEPEQPAVLRLSLHGEELRFAILREEAPLASGLFRLRVGPAP